MSGKKQIKANVSLRLLFKTLCKHQKEYPIKDDWKGELGDFSWNSCKECILREIKWPTPGGEVIRDLCFAIWHENILD